jgi:outer membrane murein-binding lipoprotein Lpp
MISIIAKLMPYKWLIVGASALALLSGLYLKGRADGKYAERALWKARMEEASAKVHALEAQSDSLTFYRKKAAAAEIAAQQQHTVAVLQQIEQHRPELDAVQLPASAIRIYNQAVRGAK